MYEVSSQSSFSAAHHLTNYEGPCENIHGHNWLVKATVRCAKVNDAGIGIDFKIIKEALHSVLAGLDHKDLNVVFEGTGINPSSENIARYIFKKLDPLIANADCRITRVEVSETPINTAAYSEDAHA